MTAKAAEAQRQRRALKKDGWVHCAYPDIWADSAFDEFYPRAEAYSKLAEGTGRLPTRPDPTLPLNFLPYKSQEGT